MTTRTTVVLNVQLDDNIRIWLLEEEGLSPRRKLENVGAETTSSTCLPYSLSIIASIYIRRSGMAVLYCVMAYWTRQCNRTLLQWLKSQILWQKHFYCKAS